VITHVERMRVNWVDTDASGLIHYTAALRYFEVAEHAFLRRLVGQGALPGDRPFLFPRVHVEADYKAPLRYPDEFECGVRVERIGRSSTTFAFEIRRDATICITGRIVAVAVDLAGATIPLPAPLRDAFQAAL